MARGIAENPLALTNPRADPYLLQIRVSPGCTDNLRPQLDLPSRPQVAQLRGRWLEQIYHSTIDRRQGSDTLLYLFSSDDDILSRGLKE